MHNIQVNEETNLTVVVKLNSFSNRQSGFTIIELLVTLVIIGLLIALLVPAVQMVRESARKMQCANHLKQIGIAVHNYHEAHQVLPFGVGHDNDGPISTLGTLDDRRYSAHAMLLPYLDETVIYNRLNFNVAPFHPFVNAANDNQEELARRFNEVINGLAAQAKLSVFNCPSDLDRLQSSWGPNNYRSCNGSSWSGREGNGMFSQNSSVRFDDVKDGLSNTAMFSERAKGTWDDTVIDPLSDLYNLQGVWTESQFSDACGSLAPQTASAYRFDVESGQTWLEGNMNWTRYNHVRTPNRISCKNGFTWDGVIMNPSSRHVSGVNVLMGDGSVRFISENINTDVWRSSGTISGGEQTAGLGT